MDLNKKLRELEFSKIFHVPMTQSVAFLRLIDTGLIDYDQLLHALCSLPDDRDHLRDFNWNPETKIMSVVSYKRQAGTYRGEKKRYAVGAETYSINDKELTVTTWKSDGDNLFHIMDMVSRYSLETWEKTYFKYLGANIEYTIESTETSFREATPNGDINHFLKLPKLRDTKGFAQDTTKYLLIREEGEHNIQVRECQWGTEINLFDNDQVLIRDRADRLEAVSRMHFTIVYEYNGSGLVNLVTLVNTKPNDKIRRIRRNEIRYYFDDNNELESMTILYDTAPDEPKAETFMFK